MKRVGAIFVVSLAIGLTGCGSDEAPVYDVPGINTAKCGDGALQLSEECDDGNDVDDDGCSSSCRLPRCGDGMKQTGEECDDGNANDNDECSNQCRKPTCGDGYVQAGEECDDGNLAAYDACVGSCKLAKCGDGFVQVGVEGCDDGNTNDDDGCTSRCRLKTCGDGIVQTGEQCDDGNANDGDGCLSTCQTASCGDGYVRVGLEECDDGNADNGDACTATCKLAKCGDGLLQVGVEGCDDGNTTDTDACTAQCRLPNCGDGLVQTGEQCDDGNLNDSDLCLSTCQAAICGDGHVQMGTEACDDGNADNTDACTTACKPAQCGDGLVQIGVEGCDDGNAVNTDGCTNQCRLATCGDGVLQAVEQCDDGNVNDTDACLVTCQLAICGDGHVQSGVEACDDGNADDNDACRNDCKLPRCGDGVIQMGVEACDDANSDDTDGCTSLCRLASCGDGLVQLPEQCDDGNANNGDGCLDTCQKSFCGDHWLREGVEQCDDGNRDDHDGCTNACTLSTCGDGIVQSPEKCDDGNASNTDACLSNCQVARCGDGYVQAGVESCDDGNAMFTDACLPTCERGVCGDGIVWAGVEACDDGNSSDNDSCRTDCALPTCGDGRLQPGEQCDDGNFDNTDGCLLVCLTQDYCDGFAIDAVAPPMACLTASPAALELTASGDGFLVVNGVLPSVRFAGSPATITGRASCAPLYGVLETVESCAKVTISLPAGLAVGTYEIEAQNPITQYCPARSSFSMASSPTVTSVTPKVVCENSAPNLTVAGTSFVPSTIVSLTGPIVADSTTFVSATELLAHFDPLSPGTYDVTVSNGGGCSNTLASAVTIVPQPRVFFVDPPVMYNGINLQGTIYVSGINGGNVTDVRIRRTGANLAYQSLAFKYDPTYPKRIQATFPKALAVGNWDVQVVDSATCNADLPAAFKVVDATALTLALERIVPAFGHTATRTGVTLYATNPAPTGKTGFQAVPSVYLNPTNPGPVTLAARLSAVGFVAADRINAVVPSGLPSGTYDVIVVNPDGSVGLLSPPNGFTVTTTPPPVVDAISPVSVINTAPSTVVVYGSSFNNSTVRLECKGVATPYELTINSRTTTQLNTTVPSGLADGSICVVRATNPDGSYDEFSALGVTNSSESLQPTTADPAMRVARRAPAVIAGSANESSAFLYAFGGDNGAVSGALNSIEAASLDRYGQLGTWRTLRRLLPSNRTLARAEILGRHVFLVGGNNGTAVVSNVSRAEILDPNDAPVISDIALELASSGLGAGLWNYRISAVMSAIDVDNPLGETLPSEPQVVRVPEGLPQPLKVTVYWTPVTGASQYRVFRSPTAGATLGQEQLIAVVNAPTTQFADTGATVDAAQLPLQLGDLGVWIDMPALKQPREGFGLAKAQDPVTAGNWYLYAVAGRTTAGAVLKTYEYLPLSAATDLPPTGSVWTEHSANALVGPARWQLGAIAVDRLATTRYDANATWIYAGSGVNTSASVTPEFDAALVQAGGLLGSWLAVDPLSSLFAGYGYAAVANQIWMFGGQQAAPSTLCRATQLCGIGNPCTGGSTNPPDPPDLENWDAGFQFSVSRYLLGSVATRGRIFMIGGVTTGLVPTATVESTVW